MPTNIAIVLCAADAVAQPLIWCPTGSIKAESRLRTQQSLTWATLKSDGVTMKMNKQTFEPTIDWRALFVLSTFLIAAACAGMIALHLYSLLF